MDAMIPVRLCVLLLCALGDARLSLSGHCSGDLCYFQVRLNFNGAKKACGDLGGQLFVLNSEKDFELLTSVGGSLSGRYWLHSTNKTGEEALQTCPAASVRPGRDIAVQWEPCWHILDGILCQYKPGEMCSGLKAPGGAQVTYIAPMDLELIKSEIFPPGTVALAVKFGGEYLDSKHLCFSTWMRAPWSCEVMLGGCEYRCNSEPDVCICPAGRELHPNGITCAADPCAQCAQECQREDDGYVCKCATGYRLEGDGRSCVDVDECAEGDPCTAVGEECVNRLGGFECRCAAGFDVEDGECVNMTICSLCEHMNCTRLNGVYQCVCRTGFRVSPKDPTKCEQHCTQMDCPAKCIPNPEREKKGTQQCFCPDGYVTDHRNSSVMCIDINECEAQIQCDHRCENLFGSYRCLCNEGFELQDEYRCVPLKEDDEESGSGTTYPTLASSMPAIVQPASFPSYIKTGSVLGITVFIVLCAVLLFFLIRNAVRRCGRFELSTFKHPDLDIYYLQQVTTETYKKLSVDKQFKNDSQRL